jgi:dTDP-4-amino-4,6-dideoxygalactose transaminase
VRCSRPSITALEKRFVNEALDAGDIGVGEFIPKFENAWATWNQKKYGVSCNSGTNAIYLALKALGIGPGDEVIVPEFTMIATAWAVTYTGATPVFVDCDDDLNMLDTFSITKNTKAIIIVPIYGRKVKENVYKKALENNIFIVEDMAEAHGIIPKGNIACYSFYGNKILTTGEGGMCITDNEEWAAEMRLYANMYFDKERRMLHPKVGHNFRMTNLQAAIGLAQVTRTDEILNKRRQIENWYDENIPEKMKMPKRDVLWMYDIDCGENQEEIKKKMGEIESRYFFKPMSMQPMYLGRYEHLNAYKWSKKGLYLPTFTDMTQDEVKRVCEAL